MTKKLIIGNASLSNHLEAIQLDKKRGIIIVGGRETSNNYTIEIEGEVYQFLNPQKKRNPFLRKTQRILNIIDPFMISDRSSSIQSVFREEEVPSNLVEEYALILQKKSNLSRRQRNLIVYQFNKHFKKVENEKI